MRRVRFLISSVRFRAVLPLALLLAAGAALVHAATSDRASTWRDGDIRVDGSDEEWKGEELPVKGQHFSLGIANDGEWLYLCLPTKDAATKAMIERAGLVVWVDPQGGKKQRFGIHFPVPNPPGTTPRRQPPREGEPQEGETRQVAGQEQVGILGPGRNDAQLVPMDEAGGIEARVGVHDDLMVYEAKVPLARSGDHPYAPNVEPGQTVRLEIETAPMRANMAAMPPGPIGGPPRPWGGGWGITVGGGRGKAVFAVPFDVTMNVKLARTPTGR